MVSVSGENYQKYLVKINEIRELIHNIKQDTGGYSTHIHIFRHQDFVELICMGDVIVPYIFHLITQETGGDWLYFYVLAAVTGHNPIPVEHGGKFKLVLIDWLNWWVTSKYFESDIYHGLVSSDPENEIPTILTPSVELKSSSSETTTNPLGTDNNPV